MIIQCDKCATKFRLDDSRITQSGVKVRCTKCDNVFIVTPPPPPEEVQVEELFGVVPGMDDKTARPAAGGLQTKAQPPKQKEDDKHLAFDFDSEVTREDIFKTPEDTPPQDDGKDIGFSQGLPPEQKSEGGHKLSLDDLDFSFSEDRSSNEKKDEEDSWGASEEDHEDDPFSGAFDKPLTSEDDVNTEEASGSGINAGAGVDKSDFDFDDIVAESPKTAAPWPGEDTEANETEPRKPAIAENVIPFSAAAYTKEGKAPVKSAADEPAEKEEEEAFRTILSKTVERDEPFSFEAPDEEEEEEEDFRAPHRTSQPRMGLIIAALVVVLGGGLIYFTGVIDKLTHILMPPASEIKVVEIESIKGFYEENKNFGKLFVIDARVKNITDAPQEIKAATGVIYNDSGDKIAERSVSPGRILSIDDVRNLQKEELERAFRDPSGGIIPPKGSVPVMVLFIEIPEGLSEFGLDIVR